MARIKIELPAAFFFTAMIPIRITDINYGGHVGNDSILSIIHEARMQYLKHYGYRELAIGGVSLIMRDAAIDFRKELYYGDVVKASVRAMEFTRIGFDLYYKLERESEGNDIIVAAVKTGMVCYDYPNKKIASVPEEVKLRLSES